MLPKMCRKLPCRNIEVNTVSQVAGCGADGGSAAGWRLATLTPRLRGVIEGRRPQCAAGCVSS